MAARDTIQVNDLGAAPGFEALQNHPAFGQDRYQIHPECMFGGGAFISAEVEELAVWSSLTAEGTWATYENDGTQGGDEPTVTSSATVRTTGKNTISVAWDPSTTGQQSQYVDYPFPAVSNTLAYKPYVRIWARSDGTMAAGELTLSFLDSSGAVIGSAINFPALGTANVWIACEFDIQSLHSALIQAKPGPHYIRITNTNSAAADTNLFFNPIAYDISNGSGPVMGHCLELVADDARTRGTFMRAQPGYEREALVGASNSVAVYGPVIAGQSSTSVGSANTAFIAPANGGDSCWVQVTGMIWPTCGAGGGTIWYPASLTSSTAVDDEEAVGQEVGTFIETATAGGNYAVNLSSFASGGGAGGGVAFANVVRDNVANTAEAAFAITGETGSGAGAGVDIPLTGGVGGATDGAGGAVPLTGGAGGATNGVGGAVPITGGAGTGTGDGGAVPLIGGVGGATGTGGAGWLIGGDSAGAGGTAGPLLLDAGDPAGGTSANVVIAPVDAQAALVGRFAGTSKLISSCTHWEDNFLGQALNGLWNAHNGGGAAAAAAIATNAERGGVDLTCGTANGASAYAGLHMLQHNFDAANGTITLAATISLSSVANGEFRFGLMETAAGAEANPVVYGGDHVTAVLDVSTSADWYFGGELVAPATSSITALTKRLVYVITVDASGNTTFSVYDPSTPAVAPSTFSVASATNTTAVMSPYFYCGYEDNTSRTMTLERFEIWQD